MRIQNSELSRNKPVAIILLSGYPLDSGSPICGGPGASRPADLGDSMPSGWWSQAIGLQQDALPYRGKAGRTDRGVQEVSPNCSSEGPPSRYYMLGNLSQGDTQMAYISGAAKSDSERRSALGLSMSHIFRWPLCGTQPEKNQKLQAAAPLLQAVSLPPAMAS